MRRVLSLGAYRRLLAAYTLNELAWSVGTLSLSFLVYRRTGSAIGAAGFYICSQFVPALISPFAVSRVDRIPPRWVLPALYACESVAYVALAVIAHHFALAPVLLLALLDGCLALTARPIARATTVSVTSAAGLLREGNAMTNAFFSLAFMLGPAIGGAVVAAGGVSAALVVNSVLFLMIAVNLVTSTELPGPPPRVDTPGGGSGPRSPTRARSAPSGSSSGSRGRASSSSPSRSRSRSSSPSTRSMPAREGTERCSRVGGPEPWRARPSTPVGAASGRATSSPSGPL